MHDVDFDQLKARAASRKRIKTNLVAHQESIKKMMDADISLPLIFEWLTKNKVETALTTLRRFVKKTYGETFYDDFSRRNGWHKRKQNASSIQAAGTRLQTSITAPRPAIKPDEKANVLGDPSDINNFFNRRKI